MEEILGARNFGIDGFAQVTVDETKCSSSVADSSVTSAADDCSIDDSTDRVDFPESTVVVDDRSVERRGGSNIGFIDVPYT